MRSKVSFIVPERALAPGVKAVSTTRLGGVSRGPYESFNLGGFCGDDAADVEHNRKHLLSELALPAPPKWLQQVHGVDILCADTQSIDSPADGIYSDKAGAVCCVTTADCLPIVLATTKGTRVMAIHAGWRGIAKGIIESAVTAMACSPNDISVWLAPCIGPEAFEIGPEVREQLKGSDLAYTQSPKHSDRLMANLELLATERLNALGVETIQASRLCTHTHAERFFSYRRDGQTGRMATLIWRLAE